MTLLCDNGEVSEDDGNGRVNPLGFESVILISLVSEKLYAVLFESVTAVSNTDSRESASVRWGLCLLLYNNTREDACEDVTESVVM